MEFTDNEFEVLDLVSEDGYSLAEVGSYLGPEVKPAETIELARSFLTRSFIELYDRESSPEQPLSAADAERALEGLTSVPFQTGDWHRFEALATDSGEAAYRVAFEERH